jgi:hypothetical protein
MSTDVTEGGNGQASEHIDLRVTPEMVRDWLDAWLDEGSFEKLDAWLGRTPSE